MGEAPPLPGFFTPYGSGQLGPVSVPADRQPARVYLAQLAPSGRRTMRTALATLAELLTGLRQDPEPLSWHVLRYPHTSVLRERLQERFTSPATVNKHLAALRGVLKQAWRLGLITAEDYHRAVDLAPVRGSTLPKGRHVGPGELTALFDTCGHDPSPAGARDAAILAILFGAGLRRSEVVALDHADFNSDSGALVVRAGKGRKDRLVYATNGALAALLAWLRVRGADPGPLFLPINKGGTVQWRRLTDQAILNLLGKRATDARVPHLSPHDLRRTFIGELLDRGADISTVQRLAGHANVETTARYDRRGERAKQQAAELLHVPFRPRP